MMVSGIIFLLMLFILRGSKSQHCENTKFKSSVDNGCYSSYNEQITLEESGKGCNMRLNVTYDVDAVNGIVVANFTLPPLYCNHTHYVIELIIEEKLSNSDCFGNLATSLKHSKKVYRIKNCENGSCAGDVCNQYGSVTFNYVYSSCYQFRMTPYKKSTSTSPLRSDAYYIETNFTKVRIVDEPPSIGNAYRSKEKTYMINVAYPLAISESRIELHYCEDGTRVDAAVALVEPRKDNKTSFCEPVGGVMDTRCVFVFKEAHCSFGNVNPGNYCIWITIKDDRCLPDTVWLTKNCIWKLNLGIPKPAPDKSDIDIFSVSSIGIGVLILISVLLLLVILGFFLFKRRRMHWESSPGDPPDEVVRPMMLKMKVLLLYPRDCKDFMNVMDSFRKILEKFYNVEVLDCFDNEDVLNGPLAWLQNLMSHSRLCTIVVTSQCAYIQQMALKSGCATAGYSFYKEPSFLDTLFIYGIKLIMEDVSPDIYHKNYVIGFDGFSENAHILSLPTSFRRYIMPNHLKKLLSDMNVENCDENFFLLHSPEYITLEDNLRSLVEYKSRNPRYLENLLNLI